MELPQYTVFVEVPRLLFPKTLQVILYSLLFYIAIWLNFFILKKEVSFGVNVIIMLVLLIVIITSIVLNYIKFSNYQYRFFSNRVEYYGKTQGYIMYNQIRGLEVEKNLVDKIFNTGTINLGSFSINFVPNLNQVYFYVQKMAQTYGTFNPMPQQQQPVQQQVYQRPAQQPAQAYQQPQTQVNKNQQYYQRQVK